MSNDFLPATPVSCEKENRIGHRYHPFMLNVTFAHDHQAPLFASLAWQAQAPLRTGLAQDENDERAGVEALQTKIENFFKQSKYDVLTICSSADNKKTLGYLAYRKYGATWSIEHLYTLPNNERAGTHLMIEFLYQMRKNKVDKATVNPLQKLNKPPFYDSALFYERFGFRQKRNCQMALRFNRNMTILPQRFDIRIEMN